MSKMEVTIDGVKYTAEYKKWTYEDRSKNGWYNNINEEFELIKMLIEHHKQNKDESKI